MLRFLLAAALLAASPVSFSQKYPSRTVEIVYSQSVGQKMVNERTRPPGVVRQGALW